MTTSLFCYWVINPKTGPLAAHRMVRDDTLWGTYDYLYDAERDQYLSLNPRVARIVGVPIVIPGSRRAKRIGART